MTAAVGAQSQNKLSTDCRCVCAKHVTGLLQVSMWNKRAMRLLHCSQCKPTSSDLDLVSIGNNHVRMAAMAQQAARVPSASWGWPCSTRSTVRKGDNRAPNREQALQTPSPNERTCVGYTCSIIHFHSLVHYTHFLPLVSGTHSSTMRFRYMVLLCRSHRMEQMLGPARPQVACS